MNCESHRSNPTLHVGCAASVKIALAHDWVELGSILGWHHVVMTAEVQRPAALAKCAGHTGADPGGIHCEDFELQLPKASGDQFRTFRVGSPRRVLAADTDEV